jgi:serine/threonine-protein kinase
VAAEPSASTSVGALLNGTYLLERVIAEGGMGVVYEAQHLRLPRKVAVKVLGKPKDATLAQTALQRFRREAEIAATLQHPHIIETFDFQVSENGSPYLVMELLEGEDLNDRLKRQGRMAIAGALRIIEEIAQALDEAHAKGVVHRDLKPANVYLTRRGNRDDFVKVLDFGVSKLIDAETLTQEKAMVGTPLYMSPEQAVGIQELTPESDVFSFGAIAFEILTGRRAFAASSIPSILYQIVHGPTPNLSGKAPGLTEHVDAVFAKVLAKKKKDRFHCATAFAKALTEAVNRPIDADFDKALPDLMDLATSEERGSGLIRGHVTAGPTEIDSSTRAEDAINAVAPPPGMLSTGSAKLLASAPAAPITSSGLQSLADAFTGEPSLTAQMRGLRGGGRMKWVLGLAVAATAVGGWVLYQQSSMAPVAVSPLPTTAAESPTPPMPTSEELPPPPEPAVTVSPELALKHEPVQWTFHVVPKTALVTVDDKRVVGLKLTLPWQSPPRRVRVVAPGYEPIVMTVKPTTSQTFEMHLTRLTHTTAAPPARKPPPGPSPSPPPVRVHESAPVQDL